MELLLSSYNWDYNPKIAKAFLELAGKPAKDVKIFFVTTAKKSDRDWKYVVSARREMRKLGIAARNIDVFSMDKKVGKNALKNMDMVYVSGGNTFLYLDKMRKTGLDKKIKEFVRAGGAYYGVSAGSIVAGPDVSLAEPFDDNGVVGVKDMRGLGLTKIVIAPHYHGTAIKIINGIRKASKYRVVPLTNRQALKIVGKKETVIK